MGGISDWLSDWIFSMIDALGAVGVGLLLFIETVIPPIPSELILPLGGFRSRSGQLNFFAVWLAATVGALVGALLLYTLGAWLGYDRLHHLAGKRWFIIATRADVERGYHLFERHGTWLVLVARCIPIVRSLISLPAGVARMPLSRFTAFTAVGTAIWNFALIGSGWLLADNWSRVEGYLSPVSKIVAALGLAFVIFLVVRRVVARRRAVAAGIDPAQADIAADEEAHPARGVARIPD
jgi:membrane protein DedA with SNARE-associated domain